MVDRSEAGGLGLDTFLDHDVGEFDADQRLEAAVVVVGDLDDHRRLFEQAFVGGQTR